MLVKITKIGVPPNAGHTPADWATMLAGKATGKLLPVDCELEGTLLAPVRLGQQLVVFRHNRNGVASLGIFCSSPVEEIVVVTGNSVYRLTAAGPSGTCP